MDPSDRPASDRLDRQMQSAVDASLGDESAFREFFDLHRTALRRFIDVRMDDKLRHRVSTSDILQETAIEAHRRLADFVRRRPMTPRIWLLKMAQEHLRDARIKHLVRQRRAVDRDVPLPDRSSMALAQQLARHPSPSAELMQRERRRHVAGAIHRLNANDREILLLRHLDELSYDDIGDLLQVTAAAARKRYARALVRLQAMCDGEV